ncbi:MAG: hypothetical protein J1E96_01235 [Ruminococcus sp.]|nr:hypothetical protein [Ruminococcus sp.]
MSISENILYLGLAFDKFDRLDFLDDFLAGVRSNYFNSELKPQSGRDMRVVNGNGFFFSYNMENGEPLNWKVNRNGVIYQTAETLRNDCYRVNVYNGEGVVYKRHYFDFGHKWLKSEFLEKDNKYPVYTLYPETIDGQPVIVQVFSQSDSTVKTYLYPKSEITENDNFSVLAYTIDGFLYFNSVPNNKFITRTEIHDDSLSISDGFDFSSFDFNMERNLNRSFDIRTAQYLSPQYNEPVQDTSDVIVEIPTKTAEELAVDIPEEDVKLYPQDDSVPDLNIESFGDSYKYFGEVDESNQRSGKGRTVTSSGTTAYEGEYLNDKRNGFGAFYYKNGALNYVGNWKDNARHGFGVGFRGVDGVSHVGKWNENVPDGVGARFDRDGNFIFLGTYVDGKKQGKGITLDSDGGFILSEFVNDEVVASYKIDDLLK